MIMKLNQPDNPNPDLPNKAEIDADYKMVAATFTNDDYDAMAKEMMDSPAMILDAQRSMTILCYIMFSAGDEKGADMMRESLFRTSVIAVASKKRREREAKNEAG